MPSSTQNSTPTLEVDKKCLRNKYSMFYKIVISGSICGLRDMCYAKVYDKRKKGDTWRPQRKKWTHEGPSIKKWWAHEGSCKREREIAMFSK